jgi:Na+/pantothenate symporter
MKLPVIRESYFVNMAVLICCLVVSFFTLLFGLADLTELIVHPELYTSDQHIEGTIICIVLCLIGVFFFLIAIASILGIIYKIKNKKHN